MDSLVLNIIALCLIVLGLNQYSIQGMEIRTAQKDIELEEQLQSLNKPPRKTIQTAYGETIDCIDIYKQPSLSHHLLKDHKIQMRPSSVPKKVDNGTLSTIKTRHFNFHLAMPDPMNCPLGTVPIRRTSKADLIRAKSFTEAFAAKLHPQTILTPGRHQAILRSIYNPKITYHGIEAIISIYKPVVQAKQSSFAQIWIENGPPNARNSLQAGWMVAPDLYGDNHIRSFIYWSVEGNPRRGCFNLLCKGFVQVDRSYTLGGLLNSSEYDVETQSVIHNLIFQDSKTGNWWLRVSQLNINVGYWPKKLFPLLRRGATQVIWGGQVFGQSNGASPEMGNGHLPDGSFNRACYAISMRVSDSDLGLIDPAGPHFQMETFADNTNCYNIQYLGYKGKPNYYSILFGGPGGVKCGI